MTDKSLKARQKHLQDCFNLTVELYNIVDDFQSHKCFICGEPAKTKRLAVDHRHSDGLIRGLLCSRCNRVLGKIEDPRWKWGIKEILRCGLYLQSLPAVQALRREIYGWPGKLNTKKHKDYLKKRRKSA
jgi:hypothetical protein